VSVAGRSVTYTTDFRQEIEAEESVLLRRRFLLFSGILAFIGVLFLVLAVGMTLTEALAKGAVAAQTSDRSTASNTIESLDRGFYITATASVIGTAMYLVCFFIAWRGKLQWSALRSLSYWLVFLDGFIHLLVSASTGGGVGLFGLLLTHVAACVFLPWTPVQALRPVVPLLILYALMVALLRSNSVEIKVIQIVLSLFLPTPGVFIAWLKTGRRLEQHKMRFLSQRYSEVRRELVDARRIHQSLFPEPITDGPVRFNYRYEPMRQIGGDFLFFRTAGSSTSVVLLDVTGHGIPAALTVNRLHGELERLFAENPALAPSEAMRLINRYVHLTLANHSVYVTAFACRINTEHNTLEYASGGHPPAFIRTVDGRVEQLRDTGPQLGVFSDAEYESDPPKSVRFGPGDALIAYTDGAIECADHQGRMLGIAGLERLLASRTRAAEASSLRTDWTLEVMTAVERFRHGPPADDTLVIEVARSV
jgi:serine phosphatase RsbU (regulator of sigma subunit)